MRRIFDRAAEQGSRLESAAKAACKINVLGYFDRSGCCAGHLS